MVRSHSKIRATDSEVRESNYPPFKTNYRGPTTYDYTTGHENVSSKNIQMLKELRKQDKNLTLLPIFEEMVLNRNKAMKSDYNIKGGGFSKQEREGGFV